jgi:hypothetical protein
VKKSEAVRRKTKELLAMEKGRYPVLLVNDDHVGGAGHTKSGGSTRGSRCSIRRDKRKHEVIRVSYLNLRGASGFVGGGCGIARVRSARYGWGTNRARNTTDRYLQLSGIDARWREALHVSLNIRNCCRASDTRGGIGCGAAAVIRTV